MSGPRLSDRLVRESENEAPGQAVFVDGGEPLTDRPDDLDGRRAAGDRARSELRRRAVNRDTAPVANPPTRDNDAEIARSTQSLRGEIEAMERAVFLLRNYAASGEENNGVQKTIMRAESELARLRKREETQS